MKRNLAFRWAQARVAVLAPTHRIVARAYDRALGDLIRLRQLCEEAR